MGDRSQELCFREITKKVFLFNTKYITSHPKSFITLLCKTKDISKFYTGIAVAFYF